MLFDILETCERSHNALEACQNKTGKRSQHRTRVSEQITQTHSDFLGQVPKFHIVLFKFVQEIG